LLVVGQKRVLYSLKKKEGEEEVRPKKEYQGEESLELGASGTKPSREGGKGK